MSDDAQKKSPLKLTELVLRDAHQSLIATRLRLEDMLPIAQALDTAGYWSIESWGGATFDACIRYLGEDPWARLRALKAAMPNTPQQMLLRGQNLLGYRHYADDVVEAFVERAAFNGIDVFRVFDALNDVRNLETAIKAVLAIPAKHAQATLCYTVSPVHTIDTWLTLAKQLESMGAHSIAIKDMAGLLMPNVAYALICALKQSVGIPIHLHAHATTGLSMATAIKAVEAGVDGLDTAISSFSMTYGHSPTETVVAMLEDTDRPTGLDLNHLNGIASYFRSVRKKYAAFEGQLRGVDARILVAQVPGGMLTNLENQLKEQNALDRFDEVLKEIPRVRRDLGYIPLVTPTSQIVGTQAVLNVLSGERYSSIARETQALLRGEYGAAPAAFDSKLQSAVLGTDQALSQRPADLLAPEMSRLTDSVCAQAKTHGFSLVPTVKEDVLTAALFPQVGLTFLKHRGDPSAFEPPPSSQTQAAPVVARLESASYTVTVDGEVFEVKVAPGGQGHGARASVQSSDQPPEVGTPSSVCAPLSGRVCRVLVSEQQYVAAGEVVVILEAMKMETEVRTREAGCVSRILVKDDQSVVSGEEMVRLRL